MDDTFEKKKKVICDLIGDKRYVPMKFKEMAMLLQVQKEQRQELREVLEALEAEGKISLSQNGTYKKGRAESYVGTFRANAGGYGFVVREGEEEDVYISEGNTADAFQGDQVEFIITRKREGSRDGRSTEGKIVRVLARGTTQVVGMYEKSKSYGFVRPDDQRIGKDIFIPAGKEKGAMTGHKVVVKLTSYGEKGRKPEGVVTEILGHIKDPGVDILSIVRSYELPSEFPERVMEQAERVGSAVSEADLAGRMDLRSWQMVTIDSEDAKDLDDAVSVTMEGEDYRLGVHIADVANYVQEGSALDREALKRGTSVYLADRVIPMLPHRLSNGICSLNAGEDRLALSCIMTVSPQGEVLDHVIAETVICVDKRLSYTGVTKILEEHDQEETERCQELVPMLERLARLASVLREKRKKRGSIDLDLPETELVLDEKGRPLEIRPYERNVAAKMIEDLMLIANECVAEEYYWREVPFLYRTHEAPDDEKIRRLSTFINNFGYHIHVRNEVRPKEIQKLLAKAEGTAEEALIGRLALRSMKQARYSVENSGHFGLAAQCYTHFTSPIRRYPDLQVHRIIKEDRRGRLHEGRAEHYEKLLPEVAARSSAAERRADEAEREVIKLKKVEYIKEHIGEVFEGIISGVTKWGVYVELPNTVEGLVHVANMRDDHYDYVEERYELVGEHTHNTYKLGQRVVVRVLGADRLQRTIDFVFCSEEEAEERGM